MCKRGAVRSRGRLIARGGLDELARTLWSGTWVDIECLAEPAPALIDALRVLPGVMDAQLAGTRLAVQVAGEERIPAVVKTVLEHHRQVLPLNPPEHTPQNL